MALLDGSCEASAFITTIRGRHDHKTYAITLGCTRAELIAVANHSLVSELGLALRSGNGKDFGPQMTRIRLELKIGLEHSHTVSRSANILVRFHIATFPWISFRAITAAMDMVMVMDTSTGRIGSGCILLHLCLLA